MTIANEDARTGPYTGNGATTVFAYDFKVSDQSHLVVTLKVVSTGVETVQTLTTHYSVSGVGVEGGGNVTMVTFPASGETLTISRSVPVTQLTDLQNRGATQPATLEAAYDKAIQISQDLKERQDRTIKFAVSADITSFNPDIPAPVPLKGIAINAAGTAFELVKSPGVAEAAAAASAAAALVSENAAAADLVLTNADAAATAADLVATNQDTIDTAADLVATNQDTIDTAADAVSTAADVSTTSGVVAAAAASAAAALVSENAAAADEVLTNADTIATAADVVTTTQDAIDTAADAATTAQDAIDTAADVVLTNADVVTAASSASAAQAAADAVSWSDVSFKTFADSPVAVVDGDAGTLFSVDCSSGVVVFNLPTIAGISLPNNLGFKKTDTSGNAITINRGGTDEIDGAASASIGSTNSGLTLVPDVDSTPDSWTSAAFGGSVATVAIDNFADTSDYTSGTTTQLTLATAPGAENNIEVYFDGVTQHHNTFTVAAAVITFDAAIPTGTANVEVISGSTVEIGTPSDGTVTLAKMASGTDGELITYDASGNPAVVAVGTAGQVLTSGGVGVAPTMQTLALRSSAVRMIHTGAGAWKVYDIDGAEVDTSASTTDGLQEAITEANTSGNMLIVHGGMANTSSSSPAVINCTTGITFPAMGSTRVVIDACVVNFTDAVTGAGIRFKSCMSCDVYIGSKIVYRGQDYAIWFKPEDTIESATVITNSRFRFMTIDSVGKASATAAHGIKFDISANSISQNSFEIMKFDLDGYALTGGKGITVTDAGGGGQVFMLNDVKVWDMRDGNIGMELGTSSGTGIRDNDIKLFISTLVDTTPVGLSVWGFRNNIIFENESNATGSTGIKLQASAIQNTFRVLRNNAATPVTDSSTTKDSEGMYGSWKNRAIVNLAADQTAVVTGTWTKVAFDEAPRVNTSTSFDITTNSRWTPGRIGFCRISAAIQYTVSADQDSMKLAIYRNGSLLRHVLGKSSGSGQQGVLIDAMIEVIADTDYFEIFTQQNTGTDKIILSSGGSAITTWATFEMSDG